MSDSDKAALVTELVGMVRECKNDQLELPDGDPGDLNMRDDLELDSLDLIDILFQIEQNHGVDISGDELLGKDLLVIGKLADHIIANR